MVGLVRAAVGGGEPDLGERMREVAVDVRVHVQHEVAEPGHRLVVAGLSAIRQALGTSLVRPAFQASMVSKYICEDGVDLGQPDPVGEVAGVGRLLHVLGHPQVGQREDRVVVAGRGQRGEPASISAIAFSMQAGSPSVQTGPVYGL